MQICRNSSHLVPFNETIENNFHRIKWPKNEEKKKVNFDGFYFINFCHEMIEHLMDQQESLACTNTHAHARTKLQTTTALRTKGTFKWLTGSLTQWLCALVVFIKLFHSWVCVCVFPSFFRSLTAAVEWNRSIARRLVYISLSNKMRIRAVVSNWGECICILHFDTHQVWMENKGFDLRQRLFNSSIHNECTTSFKCKLYTEAIAAVCGRGIWK